MVHFVAEVHHTMRGMSRCRESATNCEQPPCCDSHHFKETGTPLHSPNSVVRANRRSPPSATGAAAIVVEGGGNMEGGLVAALGFASDMVEKEKLSNLH
jgi:hypothetical protein